MYIIFNLTTILSYFSSYLSTTLLFKQLIKSYYDVMNDSNTQEFNLERTIYYFGALCEVLLHNERERTVDICHLFVT